MGSVLGGGSEDELPAVLAKWRGLDYPPFIPAKSPGFCLTLVIPSLGHIFNKCWRNGQDEDFEKE